MLQKLAQIKVGPKISPQNHTNNSIAAELPSKRHRIINQTLWLISTSRNALLVVFCGFIGFAVYNEGETPPIKLIMDVPPGLPAVTLPPFGTTANNVTYTFGEMVSNLGSGIIVIPLIALLETIAICKAFCRYKHFI